MNNNPIVGVSVPRKEGRDKVTGQAQYVDDMVLPNMLYGASVRSEIPRGRIKRITFGPGIAWDEFVIVSAKDIPGKNCVALIADDQPCLAEQYINHPEEPILLLAHSDRHALPKAINAISIEYDVLPAIFTMEESERCSEIIWGSDNTFKMYVIEKGDVESVWAKADYIVEGEYRTGAQEQLYIENNGMIAVFDPGAYTTLSPVVLSRGAIHAGGPYYWPNVRIRAKAVATNVPPHGAFRGFGAPQSLFAMERHMDRIAQAVGLSPIEVRRRNFLRPGRTTTTDQEMREPIDLAKLLDRALELSDYRSKKQRFAKENQSRTMKKGIGIAAFLHGAGFTGSGERYLSSVVGVEGCADGSVRVLVSSTEFGQGTKTVLSQIAAETLGLRYEDVDVAPADTMEVPNSGPTVASRTVMVVGKLVHSAAVGIKQTLKQCGLLGDSYSPEEFRAACRNYRASHGEFRSWARYEAPPGIFWDDQKYCGEAYAAFAWAVYIAAVTVDLTAYSVSVDDFVALQEVGRVLHPVLARGQITGGIAQAIGLSLYEKVIWQNGRMQNSQMTNYIMPTSADLPPIRVFFEELGNIHGAFGAKGIGELPMDGPAPAIANAVGDALCAPCASVPLLPEDIFNMLAARSRPEDEALSADGRR